MAGWFKARSRCSSSRPDMQECQTGVIPYESALVLRNRLHGTLGASDFSTNPPPPALAGGASPLPAVFLSSLRRSDKFPQKVRKRAPEDRTSSSTSSFSRTKRPSFRAWSATLSSDCRGVGCHSPHSAPVGAPGARTAGGAGLRGKGNGEDECPHFQRRNGLDASASFGDELPVMCPKRHSAHALLVRARISRKRLRATRSPLCAPVPARRRAKTSVIRRVRSGALGYRQKQSGQSIPAQ